MELILHRVITNKFYTVGYFPQLNLYSLELPNRGNSVNISCIPAGRYSLKKYSSNKFKSEPGKKGNFDIDHYQICNVPNRSKIIIHTGNILKDTKGCILPGCKLYVGLHYFNCEQQYARTLNSKSAFVSINTFIKKNNINTINIIQGIYK